MNDLYWKRLAVYLGDVSNNVAEYNGVLQAIRHALRHPCSDFCFRVDSKLISQQLLGRWACKAPHLKPLYMEASSLLDELRASPTSNTVRVEHVYREYNGDADGLANLAIDQYQPSIHNGGVVLSEGW